jgi:NADPH2:quinone reductase
MKAIQIRAHGGPEVLALAELGTPEPEPDQALVRVEAAGVNFIDVYHRTGLYAISLPYVPGQEGAGTVEKVGEEVTGLSPGDRVAWAGVAGSYAQYACVPAEKLVKLPEHVDCEQAAAAMLQGMTAHYLTHDTFPLKRGDMALVHAAAGGVGLLLVQAARLRGARVLATAGSSRKAELARKAGADEVILYDEQDFVAEVKRLTGGKGVQVVYDSVGQATFLKSLDCLAPRGMMVSFGQSSGKIAPFDPGLLMAKGSLFVTRPTLWHYIADRPSLLARAGELFGWIGSGRLFLYISQVLPLERAAEAHRLLESRQSMGKVLLSPVGPS